MLLAFRPWLIGRSGAGRDDADGVLTGWVCLVIATTEGVYKTRLVHDLMLSVSQYSAKYGKLWRWVCEDFHSVRLFNYYLAHLLPTSLRGHLTAYDSNECILSIDVAHHENLNRTLDNGKSANTDGPTANETG